MNVTRSTVSKSMVFHLPGCPYDSRIRAGNREDINRHEAVLMGYRPCRYCSTMRGYHHIRKPFMRQMTKQHETQFTLVRSTDTLYIRTDAGFWKMFAEADMQYRLYHLNTFDASLSTQQMMRGKYHRQKDVKFSASPNSIIQYIIKHDAAKKIIEDDYRKLPRSTRREKMYYEKARNRDGRRKKRRLLELRNREYTLFSGGVR